MQIKTRVAGVLAVSAAAIAIMGGPAFASNNPVTGNIVGNGNIPILSGNNVQIPVQVPLDICGNAVGLLGFANASCGRRRGLAGQSAEAKLTACTRRRAPRDPAPFVVTILITL